MLPYEISFRAEQKKNHYSLFYFSFYFFFVDFKYSKDCH